MEILRRGGWKWECGEVKVGGWGGWKEGTGRGGWGGWEAGFEDGGGVEDGEGRGRY